MKSYLVLATVLAVCSWSGANIGRIGSSILGHQHAVEITGQNIVPDSLKVAPLNHFYEIAMVLLQQCKSLVGATVLDLEALATLGPIKTDVQKKLLHCAYEKQNVICGDSLTDIAYLSWVYLYIQEGDPLRFINITAKLQECYNAGKELDGEDGEEVVSAMYHCFVNQWKQDDKIRAESLSARLQEG